MLKRIVSVVGGCAWAALCGCSTDRPTDWSGVVLAATILPDRTDWSAGETISGVCRLENVGGSTLDAYPGELPRVRVCTPDGTDLPRFDQRLLRDGTFAPRQHRISIWPGGTYTQTFKIHTDPLCGYAGVRVAEGTNELTCASHGGVGKPDVRCSGVSIDVHAALDCPIGVRIVEVGVGMDRISVLRENGVIESFSLDTGGWLARATVENFRCQFSGPSPSVFSRDGTMFAIMGVDVPAYTSVIRVFDLDGVHSAPRVFRPAVVAGLDWPEGLDAGTRKLRIREHLCDVIEVDCDTGRAEYVDATHRGIRPDPRYFGLCASVSVSPIGQYGQYQVSVDGLTKPIMMHAPGMPSQTEFLPGERGMCMLSSDVKQMRYWPFDGAPPVTVSTEAIEPVAISADDRFIALTGSRHEYEPELRNRPDRMEVWETATGRRLVNVEDGKHRRPMFTGDSSRVVCGFYRRADWGNTWYSDVFEVYDVVSGDLKHTFNLSPMPESDSGLGREARLRTSGD